MEISVITANISAEFLTPASVPPWAEGKGLLAQALRQARPTLIALQEVTVGQLAHLQGGLPEFTPLTVLVVDPDPAMTAVWSAKYGR